LKFYRARMTTLATELGYADLPELLIRLTGDEKHDSSSLSTLDVLWVLYDRVLAEDDRFLLSKGHGPTAFYAVLAAKGILPLELLDDFGSFGSALGHHPDRVLVPGAEIGSGSLGHGLPIAVGRALAGRRTFVLVGDGELDEGSNWEAVQFAGRVGLDPLTVVVVDNDSSTYHWPGGIEQRFALEGWHAVRVDGRDHDVLAAALCNRVERRPRCVVADVRR
jgi:transketolase